MILLCVLKCITNGVVFHNDIPIKVMTLCNSKAACITLYILSITSLRSILTSIPMLLLLDHRQHSLSVQMLSPDLVAWMLMANLHTQEQVGN